VAVGKALSIRQPWAWAIIAGVKDVENRTWPTSYRGPLLIHAGLKDDLNGWEFLDELGIPLPVDPPTGGIVGVVDLVDCLQGYDSVWAQQGCWHWLLKSPRARSFVPMRGRLGIFTVD
jgi:hypothetical protein